MIKEAFHLCAVFLLLHEIAAVGFEYVDFNSTEGLALVGNASTSACGEREGNREILKLVQESSEVVETIIVDTSEEKQALELDETLSRIGHRDVPYFGSYENTETGKTCGVKLRLTSSLSFQVGGVWRRDRSNLLKGFSTKFSFRISDLSRACSIVRDASFSPKKYQSCTVHGGDGFAFVMHRDDSLEDAIGTGGSQMGFGGLKDAIAVEFDIWYNPETGDTFKDHVTCIKDNKNLNFPQPTNLADGKVHSARIAYFPYLREDLASWFRNAPASHEFIKDGGEGYRLGTLVVWMDEAAEPLFAMAINLANAIPFDADQAVVGFTASTGRAWATHEILSWTFCESPDEDLCI